MLESATNFALKMAAIPSEVIIEVAFRPKFSHWHFPSKPNKPLLYCCLRHGTPRRCWCVSPSLRILSAGELNHTLRKSTPNRSAYKYNVFLVQWSRPLQFKTIYYFDYWVFELYQVECAWFVCVSPFSFACLRVDMIVGKRQTSSSQQILSWTPSYKRTWDSTSSLWGRSLKSDPEAKLFRNSDALQNILIRIDKYLGLSWPYLLRGGVRRITANVMNFLFV